MPRFQVFAFLFSAAVLANLLARGRLLMLDATTPLALAAIWCLLRPGEPRRLAVVAGLQLVAVVMGLPQVRNPWLLMGLASLGLLVALAPLLLRRSRTPEQRDRILGAALGPVRAQWLVFLGWSALHKLNTGFLDPASSCAVDPRFGYGFLTERLPWLPVASWTPTAAIAGTLALEIGMTLLLAFRRSRGAGLALLWLQAGVLGWIHYWDVAATSLAFGAAFLPDGAFPAWRRAREALRPLDALCRGLAAFARSPAAFPLCWIPLAAAWSLTLTAGDRGLEVARAGLAAGALLLPLGWLAVGAGLALAAAHPRPAPPVAAGIAAWWRTPLLLLAPLLTALNGASPYLGLKTEHAFSMYSNLRTEALEWNHLLLPRALRVFPYQNELVRVTDSSDPELARLVRPPARLVPFELRRRAQRAPRASLEYVRGGLPTRVERVEDDPFLAAPLPPLLRKLLLFRPVPARGRNTCLH